MKKKYSSDITDEAYNEIKEIIEKKSEVFLNLKKN